MTVTVTPLAGGDPRRLPVEIVERKGLGHPDTICDALAERVSRALCRAYLDRFGVVFHHNVDKVLLVGGAARAAFGGGEIVQPIDIVFAGRATFEYQGVRIRVDDIVVDETRAWFRETCRAIDPARHVVVHPRLRPGSADLVALYLRRAHEGGWLANDTSCGVGFAPLTPLETAVLEVERTLNTSAFRARHPAHGEDVKVMGIRRGEHAQLTVARALIGRHVADLAAYRHHVGRVGALAERTGRRYLTGPVDVHVNAADDVDAGNVYLTVTGLSAEAGDDGEAGRGNRVNGLITPYRPMTMESAAGKNPITHVGKLYNVAAGLIADAIVRELPDVDAAECFLVSRIGQPVTRPDVVHVRVAPDAAGTQPAIERLVAHHLEQIPTMWEALVAGTLAIDRWPLTGGRDGEDDRGDQRRARVAAIVAEARATGAHAGTSVLDPRVLDAIARVPRHEFVPLDLADRAYDDIPLPIGHGQTISQPFVVALMTHLLALRPGDRVLEIGTGSGYQSAVLAELADEVYSIEIVPPLAAQAAARLARLEYDRVTVRAGDGYAGWPEHAPFDAIIVTAGVRAVPPPLLEQLAPGGRLVIPLGASAVHQDLVVIEKRADGSLFERSVMPVTFVPFVHPPRRSRHPSASETSGP
jgi:S-adenosylmethionine synthetase